jgi:hypothetical protein
MNALRNNLLKFPALHHAANLPLLEGQAGTAWKIHSV